MREGNVPSSQSVRSSETILWCERGCRIPNSSKHPRAHGNHHGGFGGLEGAHRTFDAMAEEAVAFLDICSGHVEFAAGCVSPMQNIRVHQIFAFGGFLQSSQHTNGECFSSRLWSHHSASVVNVANAHRWMNNRTWGSRSWTRMPNDEFDAHSVRRFRGGV